MSRDSVLEARVWHMENKLVGSVWLGGRESWRIENGEWMEK